MATAALTKLGLYNRIRSLLGDDPWFDTAAEAMDTTETGLDVTDGTKYSIGVVVEFQDDGEQCLVTGVSSNTLTVIRNYRYSVGTTAGTGTSHANACVIAANPTFKWVDIERALQGVVTSQLWPYVWRTPDVYTSKEPAVTELTPVNGTKWYELPTSTLDIFELGQVTQVVSLVPKKSIRYGVAGSHRITLSRSLDTDIGTYFTGVHFSGINNYTYPIRVHLIKPVTLTQTVAGTYDDMDDNTPAGDCLMYLTAARLLETQEVRRVTQTDISMGDAAVQPGSILRTSAYLRQLGIDARNLWQRHCQDVAPRLPKSRFFRDERHGAGAKL